MATSTMPRLAEPTLADLLALVQPGLRAVEAKMRETTIAEHAALNQALEHLLAAGGKRVRPAVALLAAHLFQAPLTRSTALAAAVEMLHTATLVHDDLVDGSLLRRGHPTLNAQWSPAATVLAGDFLFARAAELASQAESVPVMSAFARTLMIIVNGELTQMFAGRGRASRPGYFDRIYGKTASLFEVAALAPALLADAAAEEVEAMRTFGREAGMAFQIMDDVLDFTADAAQLGKPAGSDLRQGLITLPALCYLEAHPDDPDLAALLNGRAGDPVLVERVVRAVCGSAAIAQAVDEARAYVARAQAALAGVPANPHRQALSDLAELFVNRNL
ncbi:MAG: polyprenyl synthetase family protein [Anaerolineales bacterium]|nr:polyprenyl synthetase family protein [Anaerolineales bacterium]